MLSKPIKMDVRYPLVVLLILEISASALSGKAARRRPRRPTTTPIRDGKKPQGRPLPGPGGKKDRLRTPSQSEIVRRIMAERGYQKSDAPDPNLPTDVKLGIYVNSFYSISEQTMDYSVSMYLRQQWKDKRLEFEEINNEDSIRLGASQLEEIWIPDTFFRNEKRASFHHVTVPNRMLKLNSSGVLWYVTKISAALSCPMKLQKYPMDTQTCPMMFESFGYTMDVMYFTWLDSPVDVDMNMEMPQFVLQETILYDCSQNYTAGAFPCLEINFVLRRAIGFFLIQTYIPSILIVILSWVSFWLNIEATPARVSLGLLTVLTMTTQSAGVGRQLPKVSYIKAIDVWMSTCLVFVFASLLEFAIVNTFSRKYSKARNKRLAPPPARRDIPCPDAGPNQVYIALEEQHACRAAEHPQPTPSPKAGVRASRQGTNCCRSINIVENGTERRENAPKASDPEGKQKARRIDKVSRKMFPLAFLLFNIVYWIVYTLPSGPSGTPGSG